MISKLILILSTQLFMHYKYLTNLSQVYIIIMFQEDYKGQHGLKNMKENRQLLRSSSQSTPNLFRTYKLLNFHKLLSYDFCQERQWILVQRNHPKPRISWEALDIFNWYDSSELSEERRSWLIDQQRNIEKLTQETLAQRIQIARQNRLKQQLLKKKVRKGRIFQYYSSDEIQKQDQQQSKSRMQEINEKTKKIKKKAAQQKLGLNKPTQRITRSISKSTQRITRSVSAKWRLQVTLKQKQKKGQTSKKQN